MCVTLQAIVCVRVDESCGFSHLLRTLKQRELSFLTSLLLIIVFLMTVALS